VYGSYCSPETGHPAESGDWNFGGISNGWSWPRAAVPHVRRTRPLENPALAAKDSLLAWLRTHTNGHLLSFKRRPEFRWDWTF